MSTYTNEKEFDTKLKEIGDAYENLKDALHTRSNPDIAYESLRILRDYAATGLKAAYKVNEEN